MTYETQPNLPPPGYVKPFYGKNCRHPHEVNCRCQTYDTQQKSKLLHCDRNTVYTNNNGGNPHKMGIPANVLATHNLKSSTLAWGK